MESNVVEKQHFKQNIYIKYIQGPWEGGEAGIFTPGPGLKGGPASKGASQILKSWSPQLDGLTSLAKW